MKNIVALIPARGGSKGIKNKNIIKIKKKPLIYYSINIAKKIDIIDEVFVSTDSLKIREISKLYGAKVPFMRPKEFSKDNSTDLQVFSHFYKWYKNHYKKEIDIIIHLRATTPFRKKDTLIKAIKTFEKNKTYSSLRSFSKSNFSPFKTWVKNKNTAKPLFKLKINGKEIHSLGRQFLPKTYKHVGYVDIIRPKLTLKSNSMIGKKVYFFKIDEKKEKFIDLDTKEDLRLLKKLL
tara:strand:- start:1573 stop:2277 length:705 start_codon:yes stop_codon:yes gene_type:complete